MRPFTMRKGLRQRSGKASDADVNAGGTILFNPPKNLWPLQEDGRFRNLYSDKIYEGYHDRMVGDKVDKIRFNKLRWTDQLTGMDEEDPTRKVSRGNIYGPKRRRGTARLGPKLGCLRLIIKANLDRIPGCRC